MRFHIGVILFSLLFFVAFHANAELVVVANTNESVSAMTMDQVKAIFLKKTATLPNGQPVEVVDLAENHQVRVEFYEKVARKSPSQLKAYWAKLVFTGKGKPNDVKQNEASVLSWVSGSAGRLGYVSADQVNNNVKVLLKIP